MRQDDSTVRKAEMAEGVERDIRMALWNAGMNGGMGQDLSLAFIRRAMDEPTMKRALATLESSPADGDGGVDLRAAVIEECARVAERAASGCEITERDDLGWPTTTQGAARYQADYIAAAIRALTPTETGEVG